MGIELDVNLLFGCSREWWRPAALRLLPLSLLVLVVYIGDEPIAWGEEGRMMGFGVGELANKDWPISKRGNEEG